jgi:CheY-like chemotaxis protein
MARIAILCPDLLFGSRLLEALGAAGHDVTRHDTEEQARIAAGEADLLVVDMTTDAVDGAGLIESLAIEPTTAGREGRLATMAFYAHVDQDARRRAESAGADLVVPRSRMARETGAVVARALGTT